MALQGILSHPKRFITTHDADGKAVIDKILSPEVPFDEMSKGGAAFGQAYVTNGFPTVLQDGKDIGVYQHYLSNPPGITVSGGTVLRYVDMPPAHFSPMHRTASLDYGVVLNGEVELLLDSGETRLLRPGDLCVQRATMHAWKNPSQTEWARMLFVLEPIEPLTVNGKEVKEDFSRFGSKTELAE